MMIDTSLRGLVRHHITKIVLVGEELPMWGKLKAGAVALAMTAGLIAVAAAPASAAPWNCPINGSGKGRSTICLEGTGEYRVRIHCIAWHGASSRFVDGPWMNTTSGYPSMAQCGLTESVGQAFAQVR